MIDIITELNKDVSILRCNTYDKSIVTQVANIHLQAFEEFFLTFLGKGFLKQLYRGFCTHSESGLIVALQKDQIVGFLAYSEDLSGFYKYLLHKNLIPFAWYSLSALFRRPSAMMRIIRAFLKPDESKRSERYIALSSIGVLPEMNNRNIGSKLLHSLQSTFDSQKFSYIKLETDAIDNEAVNHFYVINGFQLVGSYYTAEGRKMNEYRYTSQAVV
ncbi:MAG: GNAT family N-acetyltransferase [Clostridiales bacterium]